MPNGECRYFLTDQVDSVNVVLNDKGDAVTRTEYKPYGETWVQEGDKSNRPKFNSQELDVETGYYFYNARYYEAEIGRFITADNIIPEEYSTQSWNRFSYCKGNPIKYKDPTGHEYSGNAYDYSMVVNQAIESHQKAKKIENTTSFGTVYAKKFNEKSAEAKQKTIDKIISSSDTREAGIGYPEWAYTPKLEKLYNNLIASKDYDLLDQIGDAYIAAIYGVGKEDEVDVLYSDREKYGHDKIYQLPRGIKPKENKKVWSDSEYVKKNRDSAITGGADEYIDNVHFEKEDNKIHWDPNNPMGTDEERKRHLNYDYLRKQTTAPKSGAFNTIADKAGNYWLGDD